MTKELIEHTCCFTGHRFENETEKEIDIKPLLEKVIDKVVKNGYTIFITGMATGTDVWAAEIIVNKKVTDKRLKLVCALPYPDFDKKRNDAEQVRYNWILDNADEVIEISQHYFRSCFQKRNAWMVDNSSLIITVFNGEKGGTKNTINYARRKGKSVDNVLEQGEEDGN